MKIYFAFSIRGAKASRKNLEFVTDVMRRYGEVLTEVGANELLVDASRRGLSDEDVYKRDLLWLREADVLVAEVSAPSLGVGYEVAKAEHLRIPILCLHQGDGGRRLSAMIAGNPNITVMRYRTKEEAASYIEKFLFSVSKKKP